jgi:hypothetical protein
MSKKIEKQIEDARKAVVEQRTEMKRNYSCGTDLIEVGEILSASWGYSMTLVDFYQVIKKTAKTITVAEIASEFTDPSRYSGSHVMPVVGQFIGEPIRRTVKSYSQDQTQCQHIAIDDCRCAYKWDGKPELYDDFD